MTLPFSYLSVAMFLRKQFHFIEPKFSPIVQTSGFSRPGAGCRSGCRESSAASVGNVSRHHNPRLPVYESQFTEHTFDIFRTWNRRGDCRRNTEGSGPLRARTENWRSWPGYRHHGGSFAGTRYHAFL